MFHFKPPLRQLEAISSHPVPCYLGEETNTHLATTVSLQEVASAYIPQGRTSGRKVWINTFNTFADNTRTETGQQRSLHEVTASKGSGEGNEAIMSVDCQLKLWVKITPPPVKKLGGTT